MLRPISFHCVGVCISAGFHFVYCTAPPRAVFSSAARDALVQMDLFPLSVRCYFRSAAVKVMALLSLPAAGTSVTPRQAAAVLCRAAGWRPMVGRKAAANGSSAVEKEPNRPHPWTIPAPNCSDVVCGGSADRTSR